MANSKITIEFLGDRTVGDAVTFEVNGVLYLETFEEFRIALYQVPIDDQQTTAFNFREAFNVDYNSNNDFNLFINLGGKLIIESNSAVVNFSNFLSTNPNITAVITNTYIPPPPPSVLNPTLILTRSTYSLQIIPNIPFLEARLDLKFWQGAKSQPPALNTYSLSKKVIKAGQISTSFDINFLAKEFINNSINGYQSTTVDNVLSNSNVWCQYYSICDNDLATVQEGLFLCLDGYGYFSQGFNPSIPNKALITGTEFSIYRFQDYRVYFQTKGLLSFLINGIETTVSSDSNFNYGNIASVNLKNYTNNVDNITIVLTYGLGIVETLFFEVKDECTHPIINCVFINKLGQPQSFFFNLASKTKLDIDGDDYRGLTAELGNYDITKHQTTSFNINGTQKITVNSDYLNENENNIIKELLLSESIWLIEYGLIKPVILETKSIDFKTILIDKLIQYSMTFKYAFDEIK
jgi:hypothetical protein